MDTYKIIRFYQDSTRQEIVKTGLTLEEAREYCAGPETSSGTCRSRAGIHRTQWYGRWFEGYAVEQ